LLVVSTEFCKDVNLMLIKAYNRHTCQLLHLVKR